MYNHILYLSYWIFNSFLIYLGSEVLIIQDIQLGNSRLNSIESAIYSGFCLTFLVWIWWDFAIARKINLKKPYVTLLFFYCVNCFSLWVLSKFSHITGIAIESVAWILIFAIATTIAQRIVWKVIVGR